LQQSFADQLDLTDLLRLANPRRNILRGPGRFNLDTLCSRISLSRSECSIPEEKWPFRGETINLPGWADSVPGSSPIQRAIGVSVNPLVFTLPAFDLFDGDHRSWKIAAERAWREFRKNAFSPYLRKCTTTRKFAESIGLVVRRPQIRLAGKKRTIAIPPTTRFELAARRYCLNETWQQLPRPYEGLHTLENTRQMVAKVLSSVGLVPLTKRS
jgi:hypothetical protein